MDANILIDHAVIVTMNPARDILSDAALVIAGDHIVALGPSAELASHYPNAQRIDGRGKVVLPGLINCHTHIAMNLQKGITLAVRDGIYRVMWPVERNLTAEDCYIGALAGGAEALKNGATCVVDHYYFMADVARATTQLGLRGVLGQTIMSRAGPIVGEEQLEAGIDLALRWKGQHPLILPALAPHAPDTVAREWLLRLRRVASDAGLPIHLHVAQSPTEVRFIEEAFGVGSVEYLAGLDFLGPDVLAAHCIYLHKHELDLLVRSGAHPIYCPMGHALDGQPQAAWELMQRGSRVLIGTDCTCANNVMDIVGELRIGGASQRQLTNDPDAMPATRLLEAVTVDAARAIGMEGKLGTLAPGHLADVILLDFSGLNTAPNYSLLNNIIYCCTGRDVDTVIVNGKVVVQGKKLLTADEGEIVAAVEQQGRSLLRRALQGDAQLAWLWRDRYGGAL